MYLKDNFIQIFAISCITFLVCNANNHGIDGKALVGGASLIVSIVSFKYGYKKAKKKFWGIK
jgi:hypothetical protein